MNKINININLFKKKFKNNKKVYNNNNLKLKPYYHS